MKNLIVTLLAAGLPLAAQISGPTSGYVYSAESRALRPIRGVPGLAYLGDALAADADNASASVDGRLAVTSRAGVIELIRGFDGEAPVREELAREAGDVLFAWSGHDLAAVFPASRKALVWTKLDTAPEASTRVLAVDGTMQSVLLDGENLVVAAEGGLYLSRAAGGKMMATLATPAGLARDGKNLFVADRAAGQILTVRNYDSDEAVVETFAAVAQPVGLQLAGRKLLAASAQTRSVEAFDLATRAPVASLALDFVPTRMETLGKASLARLNQGSAEEPVYVLDAQTELRVFFVPAGGNQ